MQSKETEYYQARNLYFGTTMTQQQIANLLQINRKTLQRWIEDGAWKQARYAAAHAPMVLTEQYYHQLGMLNKEIAERTERPYATKEESEIIKRLSSTVKTIDKGKPGIAQTIQVFTAFTDTVMRREKEFDTIKKFLPHMDEHVKNMVKDADQFTYSMKKVAQEEEDKEFTDWKSEQDKPNNPPEPESPTPDPEPLPPTPPSKSPTVIIPFPTPDSLKTNASPNCESQQNPDQLPTANCKLSTEPNETMMPHCETCFYDPKPMPKANIKYNDNGKLCEKNSANATFVSPQKVTLDPETNLQEITTNNTPDSQSQTIAIGTSYSQIKDSA